MDTTLLEPLFQELLAGVVMALAGVAALFISYGIRIGIAWLKEKINAEQLGLLKEITSTVVRAIEQTSLYDEALAEGARKKERAIAEVSALAEERSIPVDYEMIDRLIEEAVQLINQETSKAVAELE